MRNSADTVGVEDREGIHTATARGVDETGGVTGRTPWTASVEDRR